MRSARGEGLRVQQRVQLRGVWAHGAGMIGGTGARAIGRWCGGQLVPVVCGVFLGYMKGTKKQTRFTIPSS